MTTPERGAAPSFFPQGECMQELCDGQERTPGQAYALYVANRDRRGLPWPSYYFSTTITSGGFLRQPKTDFAAGMEANHVLARNLVQGIINKFQLDPASIVLPSDLGKVKGWGQAEYLIYWYHLLHGARPEDAVALDPYFQTDYFIHLARVMDDKLLSRDIRKPAYFDLYKHVVDVAQNTEEGIAYDVRWVKRPQLISLVDAEYSLGCIGEAWWAEAHQRVDLMTLDLPEGTPKAVRSVQKLGASVLGQTYDQPQALLWAQYYGATLVD